MHVVTPAAPSVTQADVRGGVVSEPTLTLPPTPPASRTARLRRPVRAGADGDGDGDVGPGWGRVAGDVAGGVDRTSPTTTTTTS